MKPKLFLITAVLLLFGILLITGCEKQATNSNPSPEVMLLEIGLNNLFTGETTKVTCTAMDPDGEAVTYQWSAPGGTFASANASQTDYTAPQQAGSYVLKCSVSDAKGQRWATVSINVSLPPTLVARWPFDADFKDIAGTNHGTAGTGTTITNTDFKVGTGSAKFTSPDNGDVTGRVTAGTAIPMQQTNNFTVMMWIKTTDVTSFLFGRTTNGDFSGAGPKGLLIRSTGVLRFQVRTFQSTTGTKVVNDGQWHHVAVTKNDMTVALFVDGIKDAESKHTGWSTDGTTTVTMGVAARIVDAALNDPGGYTGLMDDVRVYGRSMIADEIMKVIKGTI